MRIHRLLAPLAVTAAIGLSADAIAAQSLNGSRASIDRMYRQARDHDLTFFRTGAAVQSAARDGELVRLSGNGDYQLASVSYPYVVPATRTFVERLARQYRASCGERLVVTSAMRPTSYRLSNSTDRSVHPAGMAVDLRKSGKASCVRWLRKTLLALEGSGVIEATEEHRPPHFHVAVFPNPYRRHVGAPGGSSSERSRMAESTRYRVRPGDSLWTIARRHGTSVREIRQANDMRGSRIVVGQMLTIPAR